MELHFLDGAVYEALVQQATINELVTGWGSNQTMPTTKVALYQYAHMINKLNHLTAHMFKGEEGRVVLIIMISDGMQGNAEFNITAAGITMMDNPKKFKDVRAVMSYLGIQADAVK